MGADFPQQAMDLASRLANIAGRPLRWVSRWCKACALDAIGRIDAKELAPTVISELESPDPIVRETALWTLGWVADQSVADIITPLTDDCVPQVAAMAAHVVKQFSGDSEAQALIDQLLAGAQAS